MLPWLPQCLGVMDARRVPESAFRGLVRQNRDRCTTVCVWRAGIPSEDQATTVPHSASAAVRLCFVDFRGDEMTLLVEMIVDLRMN
jgi:hypothetical protein